jgi:hypothetical protein
MASARENRDVAGSDELGLDSDVVTPVDFDQILRAVSALRDTGAGLNQSPTPDAVP